MSAAGRRGRVAVMGLAVALAGVGCAPNDQSSSIDRPDGVETSGVDESAGDDAAGTGAGAEVELVDPGANPVVSDPPMGNAARGDGPMTVEIDAAWSGLDTLPDGSDELEAIIEPRVGNPFGRLGSCSGLREYLGAYSVFVADGPESAISVWTSDRVLAGGIHDAEVRIERDGSIAVASGTVTIDAGLQSGSAVAFGAAGGRVELTFTCSGSSLPPGSPAPLDLVGDGVPTVEVFAVLEQGSAERIVGLAGLVGADVACPAAAGEDDATLVSASGDDTLGTMQTFVLRRDGDGRLTVEIGAVAYTAASVDVTVAADARSGTFAAVVEDGTTIDGAFRCG